MSIAIVTGSAGLIGAEAVRFFTAKGFDVVGIDNDMRRYFFGDEASHRLEPRAALSDDRRATRHVDVDIRDAGAIDAVFAALRRGHRAGHPHRGPALARLGGARAAHRFRRQRQRHAEPARGDAPACARGAPSSSPRTNKVYGDTPNRLPLVEQETRWEIDRRPSLRAHGIDETMSIDQTHALACSAPPRWRPT